MNGKILVTGATGGLGSKVVNLSNDLETVLGRKTTPLSGYLIATYQ